MTSVWGRIVMVCCLFPAALSVGTGQQPPAMVPDEGGWIAGESIGRVTTPDVPPDTQALRNAWGIDILLSNDGIGLGAFYRRAFTEDMYGFVSFSISESKDEREVERVDIFGNTFVPGKLNRFLVIPLTFGLQRRMFREDIVETFRPYINGGVGPAIIFSAPFTEIRRTSGGFEYRQVEFFSSLGKGQAHYTAGAYVGFGANFGSDRSNIFGINFRYYFTYLFGEGLPSFHDFRGNITGTKKEFGGFFITLNVGLAY